MRSDDLSKRLSDDFDAVAAHFDADGFMAKMHRRLDQRQRARIGTLGLAAAVGAGLAASQFQKLMDFAFLGPLYEALPEAIATSLSTVVPSLILAIAVVTTAMIIRRET